MHLLHNLIPNRRLIKSVGLLGMSNIIGQAIAFLTAIILALALSKSDYGYFRYVIRIGNFLVMFIAAGYSSALTRFVAADKEKKDAYFSTAAFIVGVVLLAIFPIFLLFKIDIFVYMTTIGYSLPLIYYGIIRGFIDYKKMALFNIFRFGLKLLLVSLIFIFAFLREPLYVIGVYSFGGWLAILIIEARRKTQIHFHWEEISKKIMMALTRFSIFSVLSNVFFNSLITVGYILLEWRYGYSTVADYSMAVTLTALYSFIPGAVNALLMPKVAKESIHKRVKLLKQAIILNVSYILIVYILFVFFGMWGLELLFGSKYIGAYLFLIVMSIGSVFGGVETAFGAFWGGVNKPEFAALSVGVAAGVNLAFDFYTISMIGKIAVAWGYSLALFSTVIVNSILYFYYTKKLFE